MSMKYHRLGNTDLEISAVGLGCWAFVGGDLWGDQEQNEIDQIVAAAIDAGINFFDTAEGYGNGKSEQRLGKALAERRQEVLIATKVSGQHLAASHLQEACEQSLRRLNTDTIDLYQIHWPSRTIPLGETMEALEKLRDEGKIRAIGVSNFGPLDMDDLASTGHVESNQLLYSLLARMIEDQVVPKCLEHRLSILCYSPLAQGILTGRWRSPEQVAASRARNRLFSSTRPDTQHDEPGCEQETFSALETIRQISDGLGQSMATVALAWPLYRPGVTSVLAGARSPQHVAGNARAADLQLDEATIRQLDEATEPIKTKLAPNLDILFEEKRSRYR